MSDAFQCDRCEEYRGGDGHLTRYGEYHGENMFTGNSKYDFQHQGELCDNCKEGLDKLVDDYMGGSDE